jgi:cytochrome P450
LAPKDLTLPYLIFGIKLVEWGVLPKYRQILKDVREFQTFSATIIEKRKKEAQAKNLVAKSESRSLIDILLNQGSTAPELCFTTQEIIDEFVTFVGAGSTTTGGTVGKILYYLSQNPQYKEKLMQEVNKYFADPSKVTLDTLNQMDFMTAFIKETLRFSPPLMGLLEREAIRDHALGAIKIRKGTAVNLGALLNNFNSTYHDDVDVFYPERWLTNSKTKESIARDPFVYIPFSSGARNCIGQHLAMNEVRVILSLFLKKYDFELDPNYKHQMTLRIAYEPLNIMNFKLIAK